MFRQKGWQMCKEICRRQGLRAWDLGLEFVTNSREPRFVRVLAIRVLGCYGDSTTTTQGLGKKTFQRLLYLPQALDPAH